MAYRYVTPQLLSNIVLITAHSSLSRSGSTSVSYIKPEGLICRLSWFRCTLLDLFRATHNPGNRSYNSYRNLPIVYIAISSGQSAQSNTRPPFSNFFFSFPLLSFASPLLEFTLFLSIRSQRVRYFHPLFFEGLFDKNGILNTKQSDLPSQNISFL